jgi:hypothetical protein
MDVELKVTPDKYLPYRYAGASGDYNPIHLDPEFAKQVVQFRGMGLPEQEIVVTGAQNEQGVVALEAAQGDNKIIKNAEAELATA